MDRPDAQTALETALGGGQPAPPDDGGSPAPAPAPASVPTPTQAPQPAPAAPQPAPEPAPVPPEILSQADNPTSVENLIANERKAARDANARARDYERQLRERTEQERPLEERLHDAQEAAEKASLKALKFEVAAKANLPLTLASRLSGSSEEELLADAEQFKGLVGSPAPTAPPDGGVRQAPPAKADPMVEHSRLLGDLFGGGAARQGQRSNPLAGLEPAPVDDDE